MSFVPVVDLTDPACEPSDAELEALMQSVCDGVIERDIRTQERFEASLADSIAQAARGGTAWGPPADQAEEEAAGTFEP